MYQNVIDNPDRNDDFKLNGQKSQTFIACEKMDEFLTDFCKRINSMRLQHEQTNSVLQMCTDLVNEIKLLNLSLFNDSNGLNPEQAADMSTALICNKLNEYTTRYKRDKAYSQMNTFVPPEEMMMGIRWDIVRATDSQCAIPRLLPCKFQYVSIIKSIESMFEREDFRNEFFKTKHQCQPGVYIDFCCGSKFQNSHFFKSAENCLQLQIATDDFEVANPLGSKATLHKICAVYLLIRNLPMRLRSKVDNIQVIALCNTDDIKTKYTDFNDLWRPIVHEISQLENGVRIKDLNIHGTLCNISGDNLGISASYGLVENFSTSSHVCRICECDLEQRKILCVEKPELLRTRESYDEHLKVVAESSKVDYKETKGIKRYCVLNDLKYFHIFDNPTVDIMHDTNEGINLSTMKNLFKYLIDSKVFTEEELLKKIQYHDYGYLNRKNVPSAIKFEKANLNQNASQSRCLLLHLPFILFDVLNNDAVKKVWKCVRSLLEMIQIIYSARIEESDLLRLEKCTEIHLSETQKCFNVELSTKPHITTHYSNIIRTMGPLKPMSSMRFESKHQVCKGFATNVNNFMNITKTIAMRHQQYMAGLNNNYSDDIRHGKLKPIDDKIWNNIINNLSETLESSLNEVQQTHFLMLNAFEYRKGLYILHKKSLHAIQNILNMNGNFFFFCKKIASEGLDICTNSIKIKTEEPEQFDLIDFDSLEMKTVYEKVVCDGNHYIIADTLDLQHLF